MIPIISVVGRSRSGKTTLLEKLIAQLKARGYRVASVKHHTHASRDADQPGKDTWRHARAGSDIVVLASPDQITLTRRLSEEMTLDQIAELIGPEVDIVLTEGYKRGDKPKVEVSRAEVSRALLCTSDELVAVATDQPYEGLDVPQFDIDDAAGLADLLERRFLRRPAAAK